MRKSRGALAYIERRHGHRIEWLTQWNDGWQAYSCVGGHKRATETFRQCLSREVDEELGLREGRQFRAVEEPLARLQYTAWSARARIVTAYTLEIYWVELLGSEVEAILGTAPENRWLTADEIFRAVTFDGRPVSPSVLRILTALRGV